MHATITITRSVEVNIETDETDNSRVAILSGPDAIGDPEVARAYIRHDGDQFVVNGCFTDNHAVQNIVKDHTDDHIPGVEFDSEAGQFFAYTDDVVTAERLATIVVKAAVEVALERGTL